MKKSVLVTGSPGSGKTYLAEMAQAQGLAAFDADLIPGLHGWYHQTGYEVEFPLVADTVFFEEHRFLWKRPVLVRLLTMHPDAIVFGTAANAHEMLDLFDRACFLRVSDRALRCRLAHPSRANPMGSTPEQLRMVLDAAHRDLEGAIAAGMTIIDGELSADAILDLIAGDQRRGR